MVNEASAIPDGSFFRKSVYRYFERLLELYNTWNNPNLEKGVINHRRLYISKMRKTRQKIARKNRKNQVILGEELDKELIRNLYSALGKLSNILPELFKNIGKAVTRFKKKDRNDIE